MVHGLRNKYRKFYRRNAKHFQDGIPDGVMRKEIKQLLDTLPNSDDKKAFDAEMQRFLSLFSRYERMTDLVWERVKPPPEEQIAPYDQLPTSIDPLSLKKLAVLKVNGGLGTSMGMSGAKSALEVKDGLNFLDLIVRQIEHLNVTNNVDVPLILMTSFNTHGDTLLTANKHVARRVCIKTVEQSRYPRVGEDSRLPCPKTAAADEKKGWYPPGHGELYEALTRSGMLDQLLSEGKEYLFVSNSDNLGAVVDQKILQHMVDTRAEFIMEVTNKTKADIKGGTLVEYDGSMRLLEFTQVPSEHQDEFNCHKFKTFNTNNLWINLRALKRIMDNGGMELDIIKNRKVEDGKPVIQLETAAGAAIRHFNNALGVNVPRSRFLPVKSCSDLLLIKSDIYTLDHGQLVISNERMFGTTPVIKLGGHFKMIQQFQGRFKRIPKMIDLDHLTVSGDVYFGKNITLRGTVIVVANEGQKIYIPDGCILENRLLTGSMNVIEI